MTPTVRGYEEAACDIARRAGALLLRRFRDDRPNRIEVKGLHDFVTEVDRESEAIVVGELRARFPDHAVLAEEGSPGERGGGWRWIVDPLDGTTNFIHGVPTFSVSIALRDPEGLLAGAIYDPVHDELYHATRGGGSRLNGRPIRCGEPPSLDDALIATGFPFRDFSKFDGYVDAFRTFMRTTAGLRRAGSAALDLAFTACGRYDGFFEVGLSPWDVAAGALLVAEAGGVVTDCGGGSAFVEKGEIVAAGRKLHPAMLAIVGPRLG